MTIVRPTLRLITNAKANVPIKIAIAARIWMIFRLPPIKLRTLPTAMDVGTVTISAIDHGTMKMLPLTTPFESCHRLSSDTLIKVELPEADHHGRNREIKAIKPATAGR